MIIDTVRSVVRASLCCSFYSKKKHEILRSALLLENVKVGFSNLRVDGEGEVDVALKNILRLPQNATMDRKSIEFLCAKSY
jgi:hypothetical protein